MAKFNFKTSSRGDHGGVMFGLLVVLIIVLSSMCTSVDGILQKVTVTVFNKIDSHAPMGIHCKSKDTDLGEHPAVVYDDTIHWKFKTNFWGTTLFWCTIWYQDPKGRQIEGSFDIYEANRDENWCRSTCNRFVRENGIYFNVPGTNETQLIYQWPNQ